jgi:hypothetical protein
MPLSEYLTSVSQFLVIANFLLEFDFNKKIKRLIHNKGLLIFLLLFFTSVIWLLNSENLAYGLKDVKVKLPLLALPVIIGTSDALSGKKINSVLISFIAGVFISTFIGMLVFYGIFFKNVDTDNVRNISVFISHIRLSLLICLSIFVLAYWIDKKIFSRKVFIALNIGLIAWFVFYLIRSEVFTGIVIFVLVLFFILIFNAVNAKDKAKKIAYSIAFISVSAFILIYVGIQIRSFYIPTVVYTDSAYTAKGNKYYNDTNIFILENGNYVFRNISRKEINEDWPKRSNLNVNGKDGHGQYLYNTLLRYLTSKGLTKDSEGLAQLTDEDIRNIEHGETNYKFVGKPGMHKRIYKIIWEIDSYLKTGDPSGYSIAQRLEYQKVGKKLFLDNFWVGTGTGDIEDGFIKIYKESKTPLIKKYWYRVHNQLFTFFICYGIFGGIICLFAWFYPAISGWDFKNYYYTIFFITATLSMFSDNTLETSTGVAFVVLFYSLFLWGGKNKKDIIL